MIFFNQCKMKEDYDSINKMDNDVLLMTYEALLEQKYQEKLEYDKLNKQSIIKVWQPILKLSLKNVI